MRPLNVNYDGTGWNADYVAGLTNDEFVQQFAAQYYGHIESVPQRIKATEAAYQYIIQEYRKVHPLKLEKPESNPDEE
jgi:hypothetical protein